MKIGRNIYVVLAVVLLASGYLFSRYYKSVENFKPKFGDVVETIYGLGTVTADQVYHLKSGLTLEVRKVFVREGDVVKANAPLAMLDNSLMRAKIEGTVTAVGSKEGELVAPQMPIVTIVNLEHLYLEVSLEQQSVLRVKNSQPVHVSFESLRNETYEGIVKSVYPRDSQFIVKIDLQTWPDGILPGMTADVAIVVGMKKNILLIPLRSIVAGHVTRLRSRKKEAVPVKLGVVDGEWAEVTSDNIAIDDELVIRKLF